MVRGAWLGRRRLVHVRLWPFLLAVYCLLNKRGQRNLTLVGVGLGVVSMLLAVLSHTFNATLSHVLGQAYVDAQNPAEGAAIMAISLALLRSRAGLNQAICLIYQGCVALVSLALIRSRTLQAWGWVGLVGALLALPAKLPFLGLQAPTNLLWTGLAYYVWPIALGVGLIRAGKSSS